MRDPETGSIKPAAHLIGFFRRLAKLRFHGVKPVLVFDGATPEIKLREIQARRQRREQFASQGQQGILRLAKRLLVQELKKLKGGTRAKDQGGLAATFNLPEEEIHRESRERTTGDDINETTIELLDETPPMTMETSEEIARALQEEEWDKPDDESDHGHNDWDLANHTTSQDALIKDNNHESDNPEHFLENMISMSAHARKDAIEDAKRQQRLQSRREFMPVAGQPEDYSQVQVRNFLRSSRLNKRIVTLAKEATSKDHQQLGVPMASDPTRRILFEKFDAPVQNKRLIKKLQVDDSDTDEEIWSNDGKQSRKVLLDSEDEEENGGGFVRNCEYMISKPVKMKKMDLQNEDSDNEEVGFSRDKQQTSFVPIQINSDELNDNEEEFITMNHHATELENTRHLQQGKQRHSQEIEDEMLARAIQESQSVVKQTAIYKCAEKVTDIEYDESLARQIQHDDWNATTLAEVVIIEESDEDERKPPAKQAKPQILELQSDTDDDDINWEDGDIIENGSVIVPPVDIPVRIGKLDNRDAAIDWENGELYVDCMDESPCKPAKQPNLEVEKMDSIDTNDFDLSSSSRNKAALEQAQTTAANLTDWAGRAFRRAMATHAEETGKNDENTIDAISSTSINESVDHTIQVKCSEDGVKSIETIADVQAVDIVDSSRRETIQNIEEERNAGKLSDSANIMPYVQPLDFFQTGAADLLLQQEETLEAERKRQERDMETVTDEMKAEIIHLIRLFGIPYVEAPAEAEAQCVALEALGLVDGVVTEDSDVFVFGGKTVYRHIFDDQKYVEVYLSSDAERDLALGRNQFVALAMLLGGDYTDGVKGVGIVNGMEILQAFDLTTGVESGLADFRKWLDGFDPGDAFGNKGFGESAENAFHVKHRSARQRWSAPTNFPSAAVLNAYLNPVVDKSEDPFSWGIPDLDALVDFCQRKMGWEAVDTKALVNPVLERMNAGMRQTRIESFFMKYDDNIKFANVRSKRLREVFQGIQGDKDISATTVQINCKEMRLENDDTRLGDEDVVSAPVKIRKTCSKRGRPRGMK